MAKQCNKDKCNNPVFGGGYCKYHQCLRTDRVLKPLQKTSTSKVRKVSSSNNKPLKKAVNDEYELFKEIWNERPHKSQLSGTPINRFDTHSFHHVLTKGAYPEHRLNKNNIVILTRQEHRDAHDYTWDDLIKRDYRWQIIKDIYDEVKYGKR